MDFMFADPTMIDELDFLYKSDVARKLMFYYQVSFSINALFSREKITLFLPLQDVVIEETQEKKPKKGRKAATAKSEPPSSKEQQQDQQRKSVVTVAGASSSDREKKKVLTVEDGRGKELTGIGIYFLRTSAKRTLG